MNARDELSPQDVNMPGTPQEQTLRDRAIHSLKKKEAFKRTLLAYVMVNAFLIGIWALSDSDHFWPIWVIGGWGIGLAFQAYDAYGTRREGITEDDISREMDRLKG